MRARRALLGALAAVRYVPRTAPVWALKNRREGSLPLPPAVTTFPPGRNLAAYIIDGASSGPVSNV